MSPKDEAGKARYWILFILRIWVANIEVNLSDTMEQFINRNTVLLHNKLSLSSLASRNTSKKYVDSHTIANG